MKLSNVFEISLTVSIMISAIYYNVNGILSDPKFIAVMFGGVFFLYLIYITSESK